LFLSTATPSVGGDPPEVKTATVGYYYPPSTRSRFAAPSRRKMDMECCVSAKVCMDEMEEEKEKECKREEPPEPVAVLTSTVSESVASATFEIPRLATILSDNQSHKVTVTIISLDLKFSYVLVPRINEVCYLKASTKNQSGFPLLKGPCAIFVDENFLTTSTIKDIAVQEEFDLNVGTDKMLKVEYKKPSSVKDQAGWVKKSSVDKYSGSISVKNTKGKEIEILISEQLPKSNNTEITVTPLEPAEFKPFVPGVCFHFFHTKLSISLYYSCFSHPNFSFFFSFLVSEKGASVHIE